MRHPDNVFGKPKLIKKWGLVLEETDEPFILLYRGDEDCEHHYYEHGSFENVTGLFNETIECTRCQRRQMRLTKFSGQEPYARVHMIQRYDL